MPDDPGAGNLTITITETRTRALRIAASAARALTGGDFAAGTPATPVVMKRIIGEHPAWVTDTLDQAPATVQAVGVDWCVEWHAYNGHLIHRLSD